MQIDSNSLFTIVRKRVASFAAYALASLPAAGSAGRIVRVTDDIRGLFMDNGSQWAPLYPVANAANFTGADMGGRLAAAIASLPATGGVVDARSFIGAQSATGPIVFDKPITLLLGQVALNLGNTISGTQGIFSVTSSGVAIHGEGIGRTVLTYTSTGAAGAAILVTNNSGATLLSGFSASDFTLTDLSTATTRSGAGSAGIHVYVTKNVHIRRVELVNIKGNGAITVVGDTNGAADNVWIEDFIIRGEVAANYIDGDGINFGKTNGLWIRNGSITGVSRLGIEGGNTCTNTHIDAVDMDLLGLATPMSNLAGDGITITNCRIKGCKINEKGIYFSSEPAGVATSNVVIQGNTITPLGASADHGIYFDSTVAITGVVVSGNRIKSQNCIFMGSDVAGGWSISDNVFDLDGSRTAVSGSDNPVLSAGAVLVFANNVLTGGHATLAWRVVDLTSWLNAKVRGVRFRNNTISDAYTLARNGQIDGVTSAGSTPSAGEDAISAPANAAILGALVGDCVTFSTDTALPAGVTVQGHVTAADQVTYWTDNRKPVTSPAGTNDFNGAGIVLNIFVSRN